VRPSALDRVQDHQNFAPQLRTRPTPSRAEPVRNLTPGVSLSVRWPLEFVAVRAVVLVDRRGGTRSMLRPRSGYWLARCLRRQEPVAQVPIRRVRLGAQARCLGTATSGLPSYGAWRGRS
jgi:hypothetical protein